MKLNKQGKQAYKLVKALFSARRKGNVKLEQEAYEKLHCWCDEQSADIGKVIEDIRSYMVKNCVADCMNGLPWA